MTKLNGRSAVQKGAKREERNRTFSMDRGFAMAREWAARGIFGLKRRRLGRL